MIVERVRIKGTADKFRVDLFDEAGKLIMFGGPYDDAQAEKAVSLFVENGWTARFYGV